MTNPAPLSKAAELLQCPFCGTSVKEEQGVFCSPDTAPQWDGSTYLRCEPCGFMFDVTSSAGNVDYSRWQNRPTPVPAPVSADARECAHMVDALYQLKGCPEWLGHDEAVKRAARHIQDHAQSYADAQTGKHEKAEAEIAFYAFRYALGRTSYAVSDVASYLRENWRKIDVQHRKLIWKEIEEARQRGGLGHQCDIDQWNTIAALAPTASTQDDRGA